MVQRRHRSVLFLGTGNSYRSRLAEVLFNSVAGKMGLAWRALSRGLALERGVNNVGPMALAAAKALEARGLRANADFVRLPKLATADDLEMADWIVALNQAEHLPLLQERFPTCAETVECWQVGNTLEAPAVIEREVMDLTARLIGGGKHRVALPTDVATEVVGPVAVKEAIKASAFVVRLGRETKGRRGRGVTTVSDLPLDQAGLLELAAILKQRCGTGGTVRDGRIEIQGDQRERLAAVLAELGYRVKRVGG